MSIRLAAALSAALLALAPGTNAQELDLRATTRIGDVDLSLGYSSRGHGRVHAGVYRSPRRYAAPQRRVQRRVWVPGSCERVWIAPRYRWTTDACGRSVRILVQAGHWRTVERPGYWETRWVRVAARRIR